MKEKIDEYLRIMQSIELMRGDDDLSFVTPYAMNARRMELHDALFQELYKTLNPVEGFFENDVYWRSKEIFSRLDKVFRLYNDFDLDLKNAEHLIILAKDLETFLSRTEVKYYLEGRTGGIHGVIENDDDD